MKNWEKYGIDISKVRGGKGFCPKCHGERKNHNDRELSVNVERGLLIAIIADMPVVSSRLLILKKNTRSRSPGCKRYLMNW